MKNKKMKQSMICKHILLKCYKIQGMIYAFVLVMSLMIFFTFANETSMDVDTHLSDSGGYTISNDNIERTLTAGDRISLLPLITEDGNSNNYKIEWYHSIDEGVSWDKVYEANGSVKEELSYSYYADCAQTFSEYRYRLSNEAGMIESGILTTLVFEKLSLEDQTLTIKSTGYVADKNEISVAMNDYSDERWAGKKTPWSNLNFDKVVVSDHIQAIGENSFKDLSNLKYVTLSQNGDLHVIKSSAFENTGILGITIPESVADIEKYAFKGCNDLLDIRFLGENTNISEEADTIPRTKYNQDIGNYDLVSDEYNRKHGFPIIYGYKGSSAERYTQRYNTGTQLDESNIDIEYGFIPIDDSNGNLIEWNYATENGSVRNLYTKTLLSGEVFIPKSINGYIVDEIGNITDDNGEILNIFGLYAGEKIKDPVENESEGDNEKGNEPESTYSLEEDYNEETPEESESDNEETPDEDESEGPEDPDEEESTPSEATPVNELDGITSVRIPDTVKNIGTKAITDCVNLKNIYCDFYGNETVLDKNGNSSSMRSISNIGVSLSSGTPTIYLYSLNEGMEEIMPSSYNRVFYDRSLSGVTKNTAWAIDMPNHTLTISNFNGDTYNDEPFDWAVKYIDTISIGSDVKKVGDKLFENLVHVKNVYNNSPILEEVGLDAFKNVGSDVKTEKICTTFVDNNIYDALSGDFKMVYMETTKLCGPQIVGKIPVQFIFKPIDGILILSSKEEDNAAVMNEYTKDSIPWRCVKPYIKSIEIESDVSVVSANSFTELPNLKLVYNKAKKQTIIGTGNLFDVIDRYETNDVFNSGTQITVSDPIDYDDLWLQLANAGFNYITIDELKEMNILSGKHSISEYMTKEEVVKSLEESTKYIVPVYCYTKENEEFVSKVPQPEDKGYRLEPIYLDFGECGDDLYWHLYRDGSLEITGTGDMYDYDEENNQAPWFEYRKDIYQVILPDKLTRIGSYAFDGLTGIREVLIPDSVISIGIEAFQNSSISRFYLPYNVERIDGALFTSCKNLTEFTGPDKHYKVVGGILYNRDQTVLVENLRDKLINPDTGTAYEELNEFTIPDTVVEIANRAFYKDETLNRLYIPSSVVKIDSKAFANMKRLYFIDCKTGEFDPPYIGDDKEHISTQITNENTLFESAMNYPTREVLIYRSNTDLDKAAINAGYKVRYYDSMNIHHINAHYTGSGVVIGQTIPLRDVIFDIIYGSGLSETTTGEDVRFSISNNRTVSKIGENVFHAIYNDGYTDPVQTGNFRVEGMNKITKISAKYSGLDVWYGESLDLSNVTIALQYANGDIKTISGKNEYLSYSNTKISTLDENSHYGEEAITVTYDDGQNSIFSDTFTVNCSDYVESISATYNGSERIEATAGINGLNDTIKNEIVVEIKWRGSSDIDTINGNDGSIYYSGGGSVVNDKLQIVLKYNKNNRYDKTAVVNIPCASNVKDVIFTYVGGLVTKGTSINLANIMITIYYTDGTQQSFKADTVENITVDPMIIKNSGPNVVTISYNPPGYTKTEDITIMGTIALPVKLIVVERPKKTVYQQGEIFVRDGLRVNCVYDNGEIQDVSDLIEIENGTDITKETKNITISYTENRDGKDHIVKTYMSINVNENQKELLRERTFHETYEISKILFRSKKTEDMANLSDEQENSQEEANDSDVEEGKWAELKLNDSSKGEHTDLSATIKAGYGFELKVFTKYKTTRGNQEFKDFMSKKDWDKEYNSKYASVSEYMNHQEDWNYLNDIYPQHVPTSNPDLMYMRIVKRSAAGDEKNTIIDGKKFIVMEKTDKDEKNRLISEGEWYNSEKIFEFPLRTVDEDGKIINTTDENGGTRRVYVSNEAAQSNSLNTEYVVQILSPAWYGYESEPYFDNVSNQFILNDELEGTGIKKNWYNGDSYKYLHVAYEFSMFVQKNNDIHTHILQ